MKKYSELSRNTVLFGISSLGSKMVSFLLTPLYTLVLSPSLMGQISIITSTIGLLVPLLTLGFSNGILRFMLDDDKSENKILGSLVLIWLGAICSLLLFYPVLRKAPIVSEWIGFFYGIFLLNTLDVLLAQFVRGGQRIKTFALAGVIKTLSFGISNVFLMLVFRMGAEGYLISTISSHMISILYMIFKGIDKDSAKTITVDFTETLRIAKFSLPFVPNSISWWINNVSDKYLITYFLGSAATGIYTISQRIPTLLVAIVIVFNQAWQISAVKEYGKDSAISYYFLILRKYSSVLVFGSSLIIFASPILAKYLFLNEYYYAWRYVPFLLVAMLMGALTNFYDAIIISTKETASIFWATIIGAIVNIILNIILIPQLGAIGAAFSTMVSYTVIFMFRVFSIKSKLGLTLLNMQTIMLLLCIILQSFIQIWTVCYFNAVSLGITIVISLIAYKDMLNMFMQLYNRKGTKNG